MSRLALLLSLTFAGVLFPVLAQSQTFDDSLFSSHDVGDWWLYRFTGVEIGSQDGLREMLRADSIDGTSVLVRGWRTGPNAGGELWSSFDLEEGERRWREISTDGQDTLTFDYQPPVATPPTITIGATIENSGSLSWHHTFAGSGTGTYEVETRVHRVEDVAVPFGMFPSILVEETQVLVFAFADGGQQILGGTAMFWLVSGIGLVRAEIQPTGGPSFVVELMDSNRVFVPEPTVLLGQLFALAVAYQVARRRSCSLNQPEKGAT